MCSRTALSLLRTSRLPIYNQLVLEEALLRGTDRNWVLINDGAFAPAIVMGISGKAEELIHIPRAQEARVQVLKRFSGGGTVVVDKDTVLVTLIFQGAALPHVECYPQPIMRWTEQFYASVFLPHHPNFRLRENDYVLGELKFGGNAQAITGKRWLHHTSLLWDYDVQRMALLQQPVRTPAYRQGRDHTSFVTRLSQHEPPVPNARTAFVERVVAAVRQLPGFRVQEVGMEEAAAVLAQRPLCGTRIVDLDGL